MSGENIHRISILLPNFNIRKHFRDICTFGYISISNDLWGNQILKIKGGVKFI